jgi:hypothetical protein
MASAEPAMAGAEPPATEEPAAATVAETHALAQMPREVALHQLATVEVTVSAEMVEAVAGLEAARGKFTVPSATEPLTVHVQPQGGLDYDGDYTLYRSKPFPRPVPGKPEILQFDLLAVEEGPSEVTVTIRQGTTRLLVLSLHGTVLAAGQRPRRGLTAGQGRPEAPAATSPVAVLDIRDHRGAKTLRLDYTLSAPGVDNVFQSDTIRKAPQAYVEARYKEIEKAWTGTQRAVDQFTARLEAIGADLFRTLFPIELRRALWKLMQRGRLEDFLAYSNEPYLPWELVFVDDPDAPAATGKGRFLGEMGLCRWLRGAANTDHIEVRAGKARYVVPTYPGHQHLASAADVELPMLKAELYAQAIPPTHDGLLKALKQPGSFDLLHFAGHGRADMADANAAELLLEGERLQTDAGVALTREALRASVVANEANLLGPDGNRPLVVINACQAGRSGYALSGLGGFAPAFLGVREGVANTPGRAGAFVGALWSVGDEPASDFVIALYRALKDGKTMAQASAIARRAARDAGEGSWLAYAVYAHPHLKVAFS